jgi:multisubunit Na+/H+ antiporter MnhG subunit
VSSAPAIVAWAWGINGAFGVLASIVGVAISMWIDIDANFWIAAALYLTLTAPMLGMGRRQ